MFKFYIKVVALLFATVFMVGYILPWLISASDSLLVLVGAIAGAGYLYLLGTSVYKLYIEWGMMK